MVGEPKKEVYEAKEVAKRLGVSVYTIHGLLKSGQLHGYRITRRWRIDQADVEEFIERRKASENVSY